MTAPQDTIAPKAALRSKRLTVKRGKAAVRLSLPAGESASTGRIRIVRGGKTIGTKAIALAGGQTRTFKVGLSRKTRRALANGRKLNVTLRVTLTDVAGNTGSASKALKLTR